MDGQTTTYQGSLRDADMFAPDRTIPLDSAETGRDVGLDMYSVGRIWSAGLVARDAQIARRFYYDGIQAILDEDPTRYDGQDKNLVVTNWVKYVVEKHAGFITSKPLTFTLRDENANTDPLDELGTVARFNHLDAVDIEHLKNCILCGYSVEVHSYDGANIVITGYRPENWAFLEDENLDVHAAVYHVVLPWGSYYKGEILDVDLELYVGYTDTDIAVYRSVNGELYLEEWQPHYYGRLPVIRFRVSKEHVPFISDALVTQQDVYNRIRSRNADDVEYNVDSLLKITGYDAAAMFEKDADGVTFVEKLQQNRILPLREGGDAAFLSKGNQVDRVKFDLDTTREAIHMMGRIADIEKMVGVTGGTSGVALKLKLEPQIEQAGVFAKYFEMGLRERVDLMSALWERQNKPALEHYDIGFSLNIPVNETEIWTAQVALSDVLSTVDRLKLIPSIQDPAAAAEAKKKEDDERIPNTVLTGFGNATARTNRDQAPLPNTDESNNQPQNKGE